MSRKYDDAGVQPRALLSARGGAWQESSCTRLVDLCSFQHAVSSEQHCKAKQININNCSNDEFWREKTSHIDERILHVALSLNGLGSDQTLDLGCLGLGFLAFNFNLAADDILSDI